MASMRDIKRRKTSIQGTQQITKAMKLVSTVKLQRARAGAAVAEDKPRRTKTVQWTIFRARESPRCIKRAFY